MKRSVGGIGGSAAKDKKGNRSMLMAVESDESDHDGDDGDFEKLIQPDMDFDLASGQSSRIMSEGNSSILQESAALGIRSGDGNSRLAAAAAGNPNIDHSKLTEQIIKILRRGKLNVGNSFNVPMPNVELLREFRNESSTEDAWRKLTATLECESKIFSLRTENFQNNVENVLREVTSSNAANGDKKKIGDKKSSNQAAESYEAVEFNGGTKYLYANDEEFLNFDAEDVELGNSPVFNYLGSLLDGVGARGLGLHSIDIGSNAVRAIDCFKVGRTEEFEGYSFKKSGTYSLIKSAVELREVLTQISQSRGNKLAAGFSAFMAKNFPEYAAAAARTAQLIEASTKSDDDIEGEISKVLHAHAVSSGKERDRSILPTEDGANPEKAEDEDPADENVLERGKKRMQTIEENLKSYGLRTDDAFGEEREPRYDEWYGPENYRVKERYLKIRRINGVRRQPGPRLPAPEVKLLDFFVPTKSLITREFLGELIGNKYKANPKNSLVDVSHIEQKHQTPSNLNFTTKDFNSLFTREVPTKTLETLVMADLVIDGDEGMESQYNYGADRFDASNPSLMEIGELKSLETSGTFLQDFLGIGGDGGVSDSQKIKDIEQKMKLSANNFKLSHFKSYLWEQHLKQLDPETAVAATPQTASSSSAHSKPKVYVSFSKLCSEVIKHWHATFGVAIKVQTVFLTLLHLCNEKKLIVKNIRDSKLVSGSVDPELRALDPDDLVVFAHANSRAILAQ